MPKLSRGTFVIFLMLGCALGLSLYAAWYRYQAGDDALRFWGRDAALQIRGGEKVSLLVFADEADSASDAVAVAGTEPIITINGAEYKVIQTIDITAARGLIHARNALLEDASLDASAAPPETRLKWDRAIRFEGNKGPPTLLALDLETGWLCRPDTGAMIKLKKPDFKQEKRDPGLVAYVKRLSVEKSENKEPDSSSK